MPTRISAGVYILVSLIFITMIPIAYKIINFSLHLFVSFLNEIKTHSSVVVQPNKTGRAQTGVGILTGITKSRFSRIHKSMIFYLKNIKFAVEVPAYNRKLHFKVEVNRTSCFRDMSDQSFSFCSLFFFFLFFFFFSHKHKIHSNSGKHTSIELKFGTRAGQPKVNISTK